MEISKLDIGALGKNAANTVKQIFTERKKNFSLDWFDEIFYKSKTHSALWKIEKFSHRKNFVKSTL